jgi:hypothetical protein
MVGGPAAGREELVTTYNMTPRASLEYLANRSIRRDIKREKIISFRMKMKRHVRNTEAYRQVVEDNKRVGLTIAPPRSDVQCMLRLHSAKSRRPVTLAGQQPKEAPDERTMAEERMIAAVREAVELLSFHLTALSHIPNPSYNYRNRVHQQALVDLVIRLASTVTPRVQTSFSLDIDLPPRVALTKVCVDCG